MVNLQAMKRLKEKYQYFKKWQQQPHQVAPMSEEEHDCPTCGTHYQGNYCPRCGQSAKISRYSFTKAFLLFLDVWGLGNRGMFRSVRDLLLRPGYMIRDYLMGMQMAYFPPFKMFFLLIALSLLVESGANIMGVNYIAQARKDLERGIKDAEMTVIQNNSRQTATVEPVKSDSSDVAAMQTDSTTTDTAALPSEDDKGHEGTNETIEDTDMLSVKAWTKSMKLLSEAYDWYNRNQTIALLIMLVIISGPLYLLFRHSPNIPDMKFSEFFVAIVYMTNMITIYTVVTEFLCISSYIGPLPMLFAIPALKQLSGYSYLSTTLRAVSVFTIIISAIFLLIMAAAIAFGFFYVFANK